MPTAADPTLRRLTERVAALLGLPPAGLLEGSAPDAGKVQCVHYVPGQQYGVHHDCNGMLRRYATCLYYLSDVEEGGETVFPAASDDPAAYAHLTSADAAISHFLAPEHQSVGAAHGAVGVVGGGATGGGGVVCRPARGDAIIWYNYDAEGRLDPRAVHAAMPVRRGEKWAANHWVTLTPTELLWQLGDPGSL